MVVLISRKRKCSQNNSKKTKGGVMKEYSHKVNLTGRRRSNKNSESKGPKGKVKGDMQYLYNTFYKEQVRALYNSVIKNK